MSGQAQSGLDLRPSWLSLVLSMLIVGLGGAIVWASPYGHDIERQFGLELGLWLRGERSAPADVVYIPVDDTSARQLNGRLDDLTWARPYFAEMLVNLAHSGATAIVFDVNFDKLTGEHDRGLADALDGTDKVVLLSWIKQRIESERHGLESDQRELQEPAAIFADNAHAIGVWPLPRDNRYDRFHTFPRAAGRNIPALPVVALYLHLRASFDEALQTCEILRQTQAAAGHPTEQLERLRTAVQHDQQTDRQLQRLAGCNAAMRHPVGRVLAGSGERIFNFYQGVGSFTGPALHELIGSSPSADVGQFSGKVVFIGLDDRGDVDAEDHFPSVQADQYFSGVELAATAFANLLYDQDVKTATPWTGAGLLLLMAALIGTAFLLPVRWAGTTLALIAVAYLMLFWYRFEHHNVLLPIVIPAFGLLTMAVLGSLWRIGELDRVTRVAMVFVPYSYRRRIELRQRVNFESEPMFGVCMHTDIAGYTGICEKLDSDPDRLAALEKEYWALLTRQVRRERGERLEISGDSMLCVWALPSREKTAAKAYSAALRILRAVDSFNERHPDVPFNTRIGMDAGTVKFKLVGGDQLQLAAGGDVANTSERLENDVNKLLGTRLLVSEPIAALTPKNELRKLGAFIPRGKNTAISVYEPFPSPDRSGFNERFATALTAFERGALSEARRLFLEAEQCKPDSRPVQFYLAAIAGKDPVQSSPIDLNNHISR